MQKVTNHTPLAVAMAVLPNKDGVDTFYVVVKATYALRPAVALAAEQVAPFLTDEYFGDPAASSLKYAAEMHVGKLGTDVALVGHARPPGGRTVPELLVQVNVAGRSKAIRVLGNRVWRSDGTCSRPQPFESMPLVFERAYGGVHQAGKNGRPLVEERNPVGVGFQGQRSTGEMVGDAVANLEDPQRPVAKLGDVQIPVGFGFVAPGWMPRRQFAGTYDEAWQKQRAPYLPVDFDLRFSNAAVAELCFPRPLAGGERIEVIGASGEGPLRFALPTLQPRVTVKVAGAPERPPTQLETVLIEPDQNRFCLSWRAELLCDRKVMRLEETIIEADGLDAPARAPA